MKKTSILSAVMGLSFIGAASAADITVYYSPTCPHCHHAREFIASTLVYEYPDIKVTEVNVMDQANLPMFQDALDKCKFESGGVPVLVIGDKCEQGYADFMQDTLRQHIESDMNDEQKAAAAANKEALAADAEALMQLPKLHLLPKQRRNLLNPKRRRLHLTKTNKAAVLFGSGVC